MLCIRTGVGKHVWPAGQMSPSFKSSQAWPAGRIYVLYVGTLVRPAGQPLCLPTPVLEYHFIILILCSTKSFYKS